MVKKQAKPSKTPISFKNLLTPTLLGVFTFVIIVQGFFIFFLFRQGQIQANAQLSQLIIQSVDGLIRDVPKDAKTGTVYISEARLTLPPVSDELGPLVYSYESGNQDFEPVLHVARRNDISSAKSKLLNPSQSPEELFAFVPKLQACARGVSIDFSKDSALEGTPSKVLSNGQTVHFITEPLCDNPVLLQYAKQVDVY